MGVESRTHDKHLERLVFYLDKMGESRKKFEWTNLNGRWYADEDYKENKFCDLLIAYSSCKIGIPIELKGSDNHFSLAIDQIKSGKKFLESIHGLEVPYGKIIIYGGKKRYRCFIYNFETEELKERKRNL